MKSIGYLGAVLILTGAHALNAAPVEVAPVCLINEGGVMAQTIVRVRADDALQQKTFFPRWLFRINCDRDTGKCHGARISLGNIEAGKPVQMLDVALLDKMRLVSVRGRVATIAWTRNFSDATITIDLDRKRFEFESPAGPLGESAGEGVCSEELKWEEWEFRGGRMERREHD